MRSLSLALLFSLSLLSACGDPRDAARAEIDALFERVMQPEKRGFRGLEPGMRMEEAMAAEPVQARHRDEFGLAYELDLGEGREFFLDYFSLPSDTGLVGSILADLRLRSESETASLYQRMSDHLQSRYGVPEGEFGEYAWEEPPLRVDLKLSLDKQGMTLNYYTEAEN